MEYDSSVKAVLSANRAAKKDKHSFEDILYILMGDATPGNAIVLVFVVMFYAAVSVAIADAFGTYSGGMRWVITLGTIVAMGIVAVFLMGRGVSKRRAQGNIGKVQTIFPGELTILSETMARAASGYIYSQQMLRERLCEALVNKMGVIRDLGPDEMADMLESGNADFVGDEFLAKFLLANRRGVKGWEDMRDHAKGKSAERGRKFMLEMDEILKRMEAIV